MESQTTSDKVTFEELRKYRSKPVGASIVFLPVPPKEQSEYQKRMSVLKMTYHQ
jgi:hypothetical protein